MGCCEDDVTPDCYDNKDAVSSRQPAGAGSFKDVFWGSDPNTSLTDAQISALQNTQQKTAFAGTYICDALDYKYICYPSSFGAATSFINTLNGLNVPMAPMVVVSIAGENYNVYRSFFPIVGAVSILIA